MKKTCQKDDCLKYNKLLKQHYESVMQSTKIGQAPVEPKKLLAIINFELQKLNFQGFQVSRPSCCPSNEKT